MGIYQSTQVFAKQPNWLRFLCQQATLDTSIQVELAVLELLDCKATWNQWDLMPGF